MSINLKKLERIRLIVPALTIPPMLSPTVIREVSGPSGAAKFTAAGELSKPSESTGAASGTNSTIGRNALCPCGSGKKFKRCCLARLQRQGIQARKR